MNDFMADAIKAELEENGCDPVVSKREHQLPEIKDLRCAACGRIGFDKREGDQCGMTQPDGEACVGYFLAEKKSAANAVTEKAQQAAVRRDVVRKHIAGMATEIMNQLDFENSTVPDEPEGMVQIHIHMSKTLAEDMLKSLRAAEVMI